MEKLTNIQAVATSKKAVQNQNLLFNQTANTHIYTLSLHDALPISPATALGCSLRSLPRCSTGRQGSDRKSTRLNSSHTVISYAVFCLKKKKGLEAKKWNNSQKTKLSLHPTMLFRIRIRVIFGIKMP